MSSVAPFPRAPQPPHANRFGRFGTIGVMSFGYRLAPALAARLVGLALVGCAALVLVATVLVATLEWPSGLLVVVAGSALAATAALAVATRRTLLLRVDEAGYRVRWIRGAGTKAAAWREVADAVAASPGGIDCVVLRLRDGRTTSIPVAAVAAEPDRFVSEIREHLSRGEGLRPL